MRKLLLLIIPFLIISSCATLQISDEKKSQLKNLGIEWTYTDKVIDIYRPSIDSVMHSVINQFNTENHSYIVHDKTEQDSMYLTLEFNGSRFVSDDGLAVGYIITFLGLGVTPFATLIATNGTAVFAFWFIPADNLQMTGTLSPMISDNPEIKRKILVQAGALFSDKSMRIKNISKKTSAIITELLLNLDRQIIYETY